MDILHLRYFSKVYETLNYSKSAEEMFITRQALRQVIRNLEKEIGYPLFRSFSNRIESTFTGDLLYQSSRDTIGAFENLESNIKNLQNQLKNDIRYGLIPCYTEGKTDVPTRSSQPTLPRGTGWYVLIAFSISRCYAG